MIYKYIYCRSWAKNNLHFATRGMHKLCGKQKCFVTKLLAYPSIHASVTEQKPYTIKNCIAAHVPLIVSHGQYRKMGVTLAPWVTLADCIYWLLTGGTIAMRAYYSFMFITIIIL